MNYFNGRKNKIILKTIALILIQAFLVMDFAWCGSMELFSAQVKQQASTLAPKLNLDTKAVQGIFTEYLESSQEVQTEISDATPAKTQKARFAGIRKFIGVAIIFLMLLLPVNNFLSKDYGSAFGMESRAPPPITEQVEQDLGRLVDITNKEFPEIAKTIEKMRNARVRIEIADEELEQLGAMGGTDLGPEYFLLPEIFGRPFMLYSPKMIEQQVQLFKERYPGIFSQNPQMERIFREALTLGVLGHETIHSSEGNVLDGTNRFSCAFKAHITEYKSIFDNDDPIRLGIEDRANKVFPFIFKKMGVDERLTKAILKIQESLRYQGSYTAWQIGSAWAIIFKSLSAIGIVYFIIYLGIGLFRRLRKRSPRQKYGLDSRGIRYPAQRSIFSRIRRLLSRLGRGGGNRFRSIILIPFLTIQLIELFNASSSWAFTDQINLQLTNWTNIEDGLLVAGFLVITGAVVFLIRKLVENRRRGKIRKDTLKQRLEIERKEETLIDITKQIYELNNAGTKADLFEADQLKLKLLNELGVLSGDKSTIYPLMGAHVMPAEYADLITADIELPDGVMHIDLLSLKKELGHTSKYDEEGKLVSKGITNISQDILDDLEGLKKKIHKLKGEKEISTLFIKGWTEFLYLKDQMEEKYKGQYEQKAGEFLEMVNSEFIPEGGFIVLFGRAGDLAGDLKERGYIDFLEQTLPEKALQNLNQSDNVSEVRVDLGDIDKDILPRKLILGTKMTVLQKVKREVAAEDESVGFKAWLKGIADSIILIDIDGMKLRNRMLGKEIVNVLLENLVQKIVATLAETKKFATYFRNGDENWMVLDADGDSDYVRDIIEQIKIPVENSYFAVGCLEGEGEMDSRTLDIIEKLGGKVDLIGDVERVIIAPEATANSGSKTLDDFIAKVNEEISKQRKSTKDKDSQIAYIRRQASDLDEPGIDNVINFTLSVGFSTGVKDYDEAKITAAKAEEISKEQSKNGQSGKENIIFGRGEIRRSIDRQKSQDVAGAAASVVKDFKEVEMKASDEEKEVARSRKEGEVLTQDNIAQGVRPEWAPEVLYFHSREALREHVTVLQKLYPKRFRGAFVVTMQYLGYYDEAGKIAEFQKQYESDASNPVDDRIWPLGDFKVTNSALGQNKGDEAIAVGRVVPMTEAQTMWSDKYDVIFARGGPSTPVGIAIPKPEYAEELAQTVPGETDFQEYAMRVKEKVNTASDVKVGHVGVVHGKFTRQDEPIGRVFEREERTRTVAESNFVIGQENETVLTYTTDTYEKWSKLAVEDAKAARKDYIRLKRQQAKTREALESKAMHEKLSHLQEPSLSKEGWEIIQPYSNLTKDKFDEFIANCQKDLNKGEPFDGVQMDAFLKFKERLPELIEEQKRLYTIDIKGKDPCRILNEAAIGIIGDDFMGRLKSNHYNEIIQPNKNIRWDYHAFVVMRIGNYNFILDLGFMEFMGGKDIGVVLIPEDVINNKNNEDDQDENKDYKRLWPYAAVGSKEIKNAQSLGWTKLGEKVLSELLEAPVAKNVDSSVLEDEGILCEQAI